MKKRLRVEVITSTGFDFSGRPIGANVRWVAKEDCMKRAAQLFGSVTVYRTDGAWIGKSEPKPYVRESGLVFVALAPGEWTRRNIENAHLFADAVRTAFRQESVVLNLTVVDTQLV